MQTPREIVTRAIRFDSPERIPRDLWVLPCVEREFPKEIALLKEKYPCDIASPENPCRKSARASGNPYEIGESVDEWGCVFTNIHFGVIGEVKEPIIKELSDWRQTRPPLETLPENLSKAKDVVNKSCANTDLFTKAPCCPRPWERYQFLRGTENAMMDVAMGDEDFTGLLHLIHEYYMKELEFWTKTDVDAVMFMDDWGAQNSLLINPESWRAFFKPLYKDYCEIAKSAGKIVMMHSDGHIASIYPDLVEIGVDAVNSQIFCMDFDFLEKEIRGKATFWGEIDRQHIMNLQDTEKVREAVRKVAKHLYDPAGGIIAQFELGPGANPHAAFAVFDEWEKIGQH